MVANGRGPVRRAPTPGRTSVATAIPTDTAMAVVQANSAIVRPPRLPSRFGSASAVIPDAMVTSTMGATSMRIARRRREMNSAVISKPGEGVSRPAIWSDEM